ncbi:NAD(P)H-quinone oxidoreductase [Hymenobacter latericus]|uniref:NAD(P)H-quinone oxidoreductase n=1 Tax=Hymenobacter sp. YIM 151858-1 TaxID=2987688 RepID=UPI002225EDAA|nr:NAD(P)H-quinone oxidoreductase [Hymenobacter sp. YIM 151858-1]UYZ59985.1 NAD(P)H-quinone oxidoreductase [Hymenobacter sp. YIM 151858-1]
MNAIVITQPGGSEVLQLQPRPVPQPAAHQVLVKVQAAGVNRPDLLLRQGKYGGAGEVSGLVPGLEIAGTVEQVGAAVTRWQPGAAVCALLAEGGYAEYAVVDARHCLPLPAGWSMAEAATLPETVFTVWHNVFERGQLRPGETLLVHGGSSGIGITAIQLGRLLGATVYATAGSEEKCRACEALGAARCFNYKREDFEGELRQLGGADVVLDMVGGDYTPKNLNLLKDDGRLVFINAMRGARAEFNALEVMRRRLTITGSTLRPRSAEFKAALAAAVEQHVWPLLAGKQFRPVIYREFALAEAAEAHRLLESSAHIGKLVLRVS